VSEKRKVKITRHELVRDAEQTLNFRQIVLESTMKAHRRLKQFKESQDEAMRERNRITQELAAKMHEEDVKNRLLLAKSSIKGVADSIVESHTLAKEALRKF
jgi:seryl-tRNA synthetase